jgi:hypothetical protein
MHQEANPRIVDGAAVENPGGTAPAHPNGIAAGERHDAAGDRGALKPKPIGGRQRENMTVTEEKALLARNAVHRKLEEAILYIERNPKLVRSITSFPYIVKSF